MTPDYVKARSDLVNGLFAYPIWLRLGWQEVKRRYRRTVFGPFWTTLSLAIFVTALSFIWAPLFNADLRTYLPYVTAGMVSWTFTQTIINEGNSTFTAAEGLIKQLNFPYSTMVYVVVWRNTIVLMHHLVMVILINLFIRDNISGTMMLFFPGLLLVILNTSWMVLLLGMVSARYRDIPPLIANVLQVLLFVTPIFWSPSQLGEQGRLFVIFNYVYHLVDVLRSPLLGRVPLGLSYLVVLAGGILGWAFTFAVYARFRRRIAFWL